jgi:hypothetical protein
LARSDGASKTKRGSAKTGEQTKAGTGVESMLASRYAALRLVGRDQIRIVCIVIFGRHHHRLERRAQRGIVETDRKQHTAGLAGALPGSSEFDPGRRRRQ